MRIEQDDATAAHIAGSVLGVTFAQPMAGFVVKDNGDAFCGAVIINGYARGHNADMTGVGRSCWTPGVIRSLARYLFGQLDCRRVSARTRADNRSARRALQAIGFREEGRQPDYYPDGETAVLYGIRRSEQKIVRL